ncbi:MAG: SPOR domain-containing protein [Prevotellaceae bacterium]|jgi:cell division septation protein DedD|nr:SPOR domain-containing protein [Prevotellaceae bacterium]
MKKTLIAFSVTMMLSVVLFLGIGLTGCDWFNTNVLGKQSVAEQEALEAEALEQARMDSIRKAESENLEAMRAKERELEEASNAVKPYHIIVGAFEEPQNADNMVEFYKSKGFNPTMFDYGGLRHVAAASFQTQSEADRAMEELNNTDYCEEAWIFKR